MQVIDGRKVVYDSDEEFYAKQSPGARPHDNDRFVQSRLAKPLRFLLRGGPVKYSQPDISRPDPGYSPEIAILDVGCRDGWSLDCMARGCSTGILNFGQPRFRNTTGLELCHETVRYAKFKKRNVIQGDIRKFKGYNEQFDLAVSCHCLEHLDDPFAAIINIKRMLKPGGSMLIVVPMEKDDLNSDKSRHSYQFRELKDLVSLLEKANLKIEYSFFVEQHIIRIRKYWYKIRARNHNVAPEFWAFAHKD